MTDRASYPVMLPGQNATSATEERSASELEQDELFRRLKKWWEDDRAAQSTWRDEAVDCFRFVAGGQYTDEERSHLEKSGRIPVEFNRVGVHIDAVCGLEVTGRQEVRAIPRGMEDVAASEIGTGLLDWGRDGTDAEDEESDAFRDTVICGMGWVETLPHEDGEKPEMRRISPTEMAWDCTCKRRNLEGARRVGQARELDLHEAEARWPDRTPSQLHASWARLEEVGTSATQDQRNAYQRWQGGSAHDQDITKYGKVLVVEMQWIEYETVATLPAFDNLELTGEKAKIALANLPAQGVQVDESRRKRIMRAFLGNEMLESKPLLVQSEGFTKKCITGKWDQAAGCFYGIVRSMIDPQRYANRFFMQSMNMLDQGAKNAWLIEEDALPEGGNIQQFMDQIARPGSVNLVAAGALSSNKMREINSTALPHGQQMMLQFCLTSIRDCSGVNMELMGQNNNDVAASLEYQRRQSASTVLAIYFDNLRRYRKEQSRYLMAMILRMSDAVLTRALGIPLPQGMSLEEFAAPPPPPPPDPMAAQMGAPMPPPPSPDVIEAKKKAQALIAIRAQGAMGFDITVDEATSSPNAKERTWSMLMQLGKLGEQMMAIPGVAAEVVKYSPLPSALADKIREALTASQEKGPPEPTPQEMAEAELTQAKTRLTDAQAIGVIGKAMEPKMPPGLLGFGGMNGVGRPDLRPS